MTSPLSPLLFRGVDLAAFAAALVARLRNSGVAVSASGQATFVQALQHLVPHATSELYWAARLTLVNRSEDLGAFDAVLREVLGSIQPGDTRSPESVLPIPGPKTPASGFEAGTVHPAGSPSGPGAEKLPWVTRTASEQNVAAAASVVVPDLLPSRIAALADEPFDQFDPDDLRLLGSWRRARCRAGPGAAACGWSPARTARGSTCGRRSTRRAGPAGSRCCWRERVPAGVLVGSCWCAT